MRGPGEAEHGRLVVVSRPSARELCGMHERRNSEFLQLCEPEHLRSNILLLPCRIVGFSLK